MILPDADNAVSFDVTPQTRHVKLLRGTAFFEIRPGDMPFVGQAAEGEARVLGTAFECRMEQSVLC